MADLLNAWRRHHHARRQADERRVLDGLRDGAPHFALDLWRSLRMRTGRLYPALTRLHQAGLVDDGWEDAAVNLHPRRWYRLADAGMRAVVSAPAADRLARALHDADCGCDDYDEMEDLRYITAARAALASAAAEDTAGGGAPPHG